MASGNRHPTVTKRDRESAISDPQRPWPNRPPAVGPAQAAGPLLFYRSSLESLLMKTFGSLFPRTALAVAVALVAAAPALAQNTTAAIGGRVATPDGKPVAGATVVVLHRESGSVATLTTDADGRYNARGLRAGGPYTITVSKGGERSVNDEVYLVLAETTVIDLRLGTAQALEQVVVTSAGGGKINGTSKGAGTNLSGQELSAHFSIQRNLQDYARLDPRIAQTNKENGEISAAGQNIRFNSITVDGVSINDTFGLESNNLPMARQPVSMDAIASVQVNLSNYDVTQKGYTGANINAVTKSGTNLFKGSAYGVYRDAEMTGRRWNRPPTDTYTRLSSFTEKLFGATFSGPIIKDNLFFFLTYEKSENSISSPAFGVAGSTNATAVNVTQAQIDSVIAAAKNKWGFDAGTLAIPQGLNLSYEEISAKLNWNVSENHRAEFSFRNSEQSEPQLPGFGNTSLSLNSHWYPQDKTNKTYVGQWFADWTDDFSTELKVSKRDYLSLPIPVSNLPLVTLSWTNGATRSLILGTERSRHFNRLQTKTVDAYFAGNLFLGDHELKFGADLAKNDIYNAFLQDTRGNYTFSGSGAPGTATDPVTLFLNGTPTRYQVQLPLAGRALTDAVANWTLNSQGLFLQDTWKVSKKLSVNGGIRIDRLSTSDRPTYNAAFAAPLVEGVVATNTRQSGGFGLTNTTTIDGEKLVQPRVGFNYQFDAIDKRKSQLRGGLGLFQGSAANVWLTNPFQNNGAAVGTYTCGTGTSVSCASVTFSPDGSNQPSVAGTPPAPNVDLIQPGVTQPSVWKMNLAWDGELPFFGLEGGVEWLHTRVNDGLYYQALNLGTVTGKAPDGRDVYYNAKGVSESCWTGGGTAITSGCGLVSRSLSNSAFGNVYMVAPTDKGSGNALTLQVSQRLGSALRWNAAYTRTSMTEVSPLASSTSGSNWNNRANFNPNENVAANSQYLIRDRISASVNWSKALFDGKHKTTVGLFYEGRSGKPYSWVFRNDMNGDGRNINDLMYIPKGPGSGEVLFRLPGSANTVENSGAAAEAKFWQIVDSFQHLRDSKGKVVSRNGEFAPWVNSIDMRLQQEMPGIFKGNKGVLSLDFMNVGNLLNRRWGQVSEVGFPSMRSFVNYAGTRDGKMVYSVTDPDALVTPTDSTNRSKYAQWSIQVTARYEF
jgi:hypothetical protein